MVARMPELRAGAFFPLGQLANNFTIYPSTRRGLLLWIWRPPPHNSEIQQMSDSKDECKECSSLGTIVNCEVSLTVCGERWQNGCPFMLPWSFNFLPSARERERATVYISVGRLALRLVNPSRAKVTSEQNNRCQWKRGQNLAAPITVRNNLPCLTHTLAAWHQRIKLNEFDRMIKNCMHIYIHVDGIPSILVMKQLASFAWHLWGVFSLGWTPLSIFISAVGLDQFRPGSIALLSANEPDLGDPKIRMATEQNLLVFFPGRDRCVQIFTPSHIWERGVAP